MSDVRLQVPCDLDEREVAGMADAILGAVGVPEAELSILVTSDEHIAELNARWRGVQGATDVLSFSQDTVPGAPRVLGDVVIGIGRAAGQAAERGHTLRDELWVLLVHGVLHLLGYDHETDEERAEMSDAEERVLGTLGQSMSSGLVGRSDEG